MLAQLQALNDYDGNWRRAAMPVEYFDVSMSRLLG